jgi:hypothetical protein
MPGCGKVRLNPSIFGVPVHAYSCTTPPAEVLPLDTSLQYFEVIQGCATVRGSDHPRGMPLVTQQRFKRSKNIEIKHFLECKSLP